jgi:hypothetical protein
MGNIDRMVVIDNGSGGNGGGLNKLAQTTPTVVFGLLQQLQALGLDVPTMMHQLGLKNGNETEVQKNAAAQG